jgi:carbon storage regulator
MLVLTRQVDEAIMIGDAVEVTVVEVRGGKVRLGIRAPAAVAVHRKEVYLAIQHANQEAAQVGPEVLRRLPAILPRPAAPPPASRKE